MFTGVGERTREGTDLYLEMSESGVINKTCLVYGQMNEPPGARLRIGLAGLTTAEYFRDRGQDVLLFIDNIFRFSQAGSEVSALLGRMPSAVGYQPTLATEMGDIEYGLTFIDIRFVHEKTPLRFCRLPVALVEKRKDATSPERRLLYAGCVLTCGNTDAARISAHSIR